MKKFKFWPIILLISTLQAEEIHCFDTLFRHPFTSEQTFELTAIYTDLRTNKIIVVINNEEYTIGSKIGDFRINATNNKDTFILTNGNMKKTLSLHPNQQKNRPQ